MSSAADPEGEVEAQAPSTPQQKNPIVLVAIIVAVIAGGIYGFKTLSYNSTHASTDDAQVAADLVQVAPKVVGTVLKVYVEDNQEVKAGDLIAELDPSSFQTAVEQAEANLAQARAQTQQATVNVGLTGAMGDAQLLQAQGQVDQSQGAVQGSIADVSRFRAAEMAAQAQASGARANIRSAQAGLAAALANLSKARDGVVQSRAQVASSEATARAAEAGIESASATRQKAQRDAERYAILHKEGVISAQTAEQSATQYSVARSNEDAAREQAKSAEANVALRRQEVETAVSQVTAAEAAVAQARAAVQASRDQARAADAAVSQAVAQSQAASTSIEQAKGRSRQAEGALAQAKTAPTQLKISQVQTQQADARVKQAEAALKDAQLKLGWTKIYAPASGKVSKKSVTVGEQVQIGTPLLAIVPSGSEWVVANYKETQLADIKVGQAAEVELDAFAGAPLKGHVDSISAGTGATFALLPPDNATGNYTKVVQRVPVKIVFEPGQDGLKNLRVGLSVTASISTKEK